ncbi:glycosyltransferase [Streptomyces sp. NBC_00365]|uniref:glycosyltransferase family 4 protein n=1 Tax=Streptomyces sp. NBC_00365 TaxID=2975726 RepID=UPI00224ECA7A|nr:glycosyltransferase [Streptomyces sp. NBC_00365]MCX5090349.1 glycosyltransferase [Streptomyces sp. NBC_00365]
MHQVRQSEMDKHRRWAVVAESRTQIVEAGAVAAATLGREPELVIAASDALRDIRGYRAEIQRRGVSAVALFSSDASRRAYTTVYELLLALAPVQERRIIDARQPGKPLTVGSVWLLGARCALDAATAAGFVVGELARGTSPELPGPVSPSTSRWILALWRDAAESSVGGAVNHVSGILAGFRRLGWQVALVTNGEPPEQLRSAVDVLEVTAPLPRGARFTKESAWVASNNAMHEVALSLARRTPPAFVYQRNAFLCRVGADLSRQLAVPMVLEWNNSVVWANRNWYQQGPQSRLFQMIGDRIERYSARSATLVAAVSRKAAEMATEQGADPAAVAVVTNAVDAESVPAPPPIPARQEVLLGWVGGFGRYHGVEVAIESLRDLPDDVELLLIGDGPERGTCEELARRLSVHDRITWTGALPRSEALRMLSCCDILVSPHCWTVKGSFFGSPVKLFEYMALGRPIVASRLEQISEILQDGVTAVLTEPGDPVDLARGITRVLARSDRGMALGASARQEALELHTWERRAEQILARLPMQAAHLTGAGTDHV